MSETALRTASPAAPPGRARDGGPAALDAFLDPEVRRAIEETWSARINEQATLAAALRRPELPPRRRAGMSRSMPTTGWCTPATWR